MPNYYNSYPKKRKFNPLIKTSKKENLNRKLLQMKPNHEQTLSSISSSSMPSKNGSLRSCAAEGRALG